MLILHYNSVLGDVSVISHTETDLMLRLTLPEGTKCKCKATIKGNALCTNLGVVTLSDKELENIKKYFKT